MKSSQCKPCKPLCGDKRRQTVHYRQILGSRESELHHILCWRGRLEGKAEGMLSAIYDIAASCSPWIDGAGERLPLFQSFLHPPLLFQVITYTRWEIPMFARGSCPNAVQSRQHIFLISCQTPRVNSYNLSFLEWLYFVFISDEINLHDLCSETYTVYWILIRRVLSCHCSANTHAPKNYCCRHSTCGLGAHSLEKLL